MVRVILLLIFSCTILFILFQYAYSDSYRYCIGNKHVIKHDTPTIHMLSKRKEGSNSYLRFLRGNILKFSVEGAKIIGYLSTSSFKDDALENFSGPGDKEGYFVFDIETDHLISGLDKSRYKKILLKDNIDEATINYIRELTPYSVLTCL